MPSVWGLPQCCSRRAPKTSKEYYQNIVKHRKNITKILLNQTNLRSTGHLDHIAGRVSVCASDMDLGRLAGDLLDRAHEDVRDDRDAKKAGNVSFSSRYSFYTDVLMQNRYFGYWIYKTWIILIFQLYWICIYFSCRDNTSLRLYSLDPLCLWQ